MPQKMSYQEEEDEFYGQQQQQQQPRRGHGPSSSPSEARPPAPSQGSVAAAAAHSLQYQQQPPLPPTSQHTYMPSSSIQQGPSAVPTALRSAPKQDAAAAADRRLSPASFRSQSIEDPAGLGISVERPTRYQSKQAVLPQPPTTAHQSDSDATNGLPPKQDEDDQPRSRASSFFLGGPSDSTQSASAAAAAASTSASAGQHVHQPDYQRSSSNESQEEQQSESGGSHNPSHARRSSFYGLDAGPSPAPTASVGHSDAFAPPDAPNRPIPRSGSAGLPTPDSRHFRQSFTDPGSWSRRRQNRSVSGLSAGHAASSCSDGIPPVPRITHRDHLELAAGESLMPRLQALQLYRQNCKKSNDPDLVFDFATHILNLVQDLTDEELDKDIAVGTTGSAKDHPGSRRSSMLQRATPKLKSITPSPSNGSFAHAPAAGGAAGNGSGGSASSSSSSVHHGLPDPRAHSPNNGQQQPPRASQDQISFDTDLADTKRNALIIEAAQLLKRGADKGHLDSQILLANLHLRGTLNAKGKADWNRAFPLFVLAGKRGHTEAAFRSGQGYENGWGTRKDASKAVQWYRKAASANHPGAMFRLGMAELKGELGMPVKAKEGFKWINRTAERADSDDPTEESLLALEELGRLHEVGVEHVVFVDPEYAAECYAKAAELGHADSAYKLGENYEYGTNGCPKDPALSIHYYNIAAQRFHPVACFGVAAWYLRGVDGILPQSDTEAYLWSKRAAERDLPKAQFACGYFCESGTGTYQDLREAMEWYRKAADNGETRAIKRLQEAKAQGTPIPLAPQSQNAPVGAAQSKSDKKRRTMAERNREDLASHEKDDKNCIIS